MIKRKMVDGQFPYFPKSVSPKGKKKGNKSPKLETLSEHDKSEADTAD